MSAKRRLTAIKFDKERLITKFGYLDHNSHKVMYERMVFNADSLADAVEKFLSGLIERHYPFETDHDFMVNFIAIDYEFGEPCKLTFSLKFSGEGCGEMGFSFPSLPCQIVERNSDLIEELSDLALEFWDDFQYSLPKQGDLFALPELEEIAEKLNIEGIEITKGVAIEAA